MSNPSYTIASCKKCRQGETRAGKCRVCGGSGKVKLTVVEGRTIVEPYAPPEPVVKPGHKGAGDNKDKSSVKS